MMPPGVVAVPYFFFFSGTGGPPPATPVSIVQVINVIGRQPMIVKVKGVV